MKAVLSLVAASAILSATGASAQTSCIAPFQAYQYGFNVGKGWADQEQLKFAGQLVITGGTSFGGPQLCNDVTSIISCKSGTAAGADSVQPMFVAGVYVPGGAQLKHQNIPAWASFQQMVCRPTTP